MGNQGLFTNNQVLAFYLLYLFLNITYIGFAGTFLFMKNLSSQIFVYLHNFEYSWLENNGITNLSRNSVMYKIFSNFFLSLLFWHIILSPIVLIQFLMPRETAIILLPVAPQLIIPLLGYVSKIFFTIFPASTGETGILALLNSMIQTGLLKITKDKRISAWLGLILITVFSGFAWLIVHGFVSQGQQLNEQSHFYFGAEQGFLMVLTGSIAPAIALHNINLLFYGFLKLVGENELARISIPVVIMIVWVGTIWIIARLNKR